MTTQQAATNLPAPGYYWACFERDENGHVLNCGCEKSSTSGSPQIRITILVTHKNVNGEWKELDRPMRRTMFWALSGNAIDYTFQKLEHLQHNGDLANMDFAPEKDGGFSAICEHHTYNNKTSDRWDLADWGGGEVKKGDPLDGQTLAQLQLRYKRERGNKSAPGQPTQPPAQTQEPQPAQPATQQGAQTSAPYSAPPSAPPPPARTTHQNAADDGEIPF